MKIEIDLDDILGDEYGAETLNESIKRQVIDNLTRTLSDNVTKKINEEVGIQINTAVRDGVVNRMQDIIDDVLNAKYIPVSNYGSRGDETTFRASLIKEITSQMVYKKDQYNENLFTKSVNGVISEQMKIIQKDFIEQCNTEIAKKAFSDAVQLLKTKLGV